MFKFFDKLFGKQSKNSKSANNMAGDAKSQPGFVLRDPNKCTVAVTDTGIILHEIHSEDKMMQWDEITAVFIVAIDGMPIGKISWMLHAGKTIIEVPTSSMGNKELLHSLQERLPDFDNSALIEAMGMIHGFKQIWKRDY